MAGAAGREDGGAGEGRRPARPQWRSLGERKRAVAAGGEGGAGAPPRPCQRTYGGPVEGAAPRRATRRALTRAVARGGRAPFLRRPPGGGGECCGPAPLPGTRSVFPGVFPGAGGAEPSAAAPRSRWPGPSPLRGGTCVARRARVCGFGGGWSLSPTLPARSSPARPETGVGKGRAEHFTGL